MEHKGTLEIDTQRLLLRPLTQADAEAAFRNWTSDDEVTKYLTWPTHRSVDDTRGFMSWCEGTYADLSSYQWGIVLKDIGEVIGTISVVRADEAIASFELGWVIGRKWWGQGIMTEAASAVIGFLFTQVGANRVAARHDLRNAGSGRVMQKVGMTYEGTLRSCDRNNQGIVDCACYSILKSEYETKA